MKSCVVTNFRQEGVFSGKHTSGVSGQTVDAFGTLSNMLKFELNPAGGDKEPYKGFK